MNYDYIFIRTLSDLKDRITSDDPYQILGIVLLLRKLILDKTCLLDVVNRKRKLKLVFTIHDDPVPKDSSAIYWCTEGVLDPKVSCVPVRNVLELKKDEFLRVKVLKYYDEIFSIKDVIKHLAHVVGAVHIGEPKKKKEKILKLVSETVVVDSQPALFRLIQAIASVVLASLEPLRKKVFSEAKANVYSDKILDILDQVSRIEEKDELSKKKGKKDERT